MLAANVETKARCADLRGVAQLAAEIGARYEGRLDQMDTYFNAARGRLKLRELTHTTPGGQISTSAELIRYQRPDKSGARVSMYERTELADPESCRVRLEEEVGVRGRVSKRRELWLLGATRIHLDQVEGLGMFVELETVTAGTPAEADRLEHDRIAAALGLDSRPTVAGSYIDLVESLPPAL
jgi:adenylate cyclase class IV